MTLQKLLLRSLAVLSLLTISMITLNGCGLGEPAAVTGITPGEIGGKAIGGEPAIGGADVYLLYTGSTGYGSAATYTSGSWASHTTTATDGSGYFTLPTANTACTGTQQAYIVLKGGNTGAGTNPNSYLVAAIGSCSTLASTTFVVVNEATTVAAAYALGNFATTSTTAPYVTIGAPPTNNVATGAVISAAFGTASAPTALVGASSTASFANVVNDSIPVSGTIAFMVAGTGYSATIPSVASASAFMTAFNGTTASSMSGVTAAASGNTVTLTGPVGTTNTLVFTSPALFPVSSTTYNTYAAGLSHAFINAANLVTVGNGQPQSAPTVSANVTVTAPLTMVNALANIAESCVNSTGGSASSTSPAFSTPYTATNTAPAVTTLVFPNSSTAVNGPVAFNYASGSSSAPISGTTGPAAFAAAFNSTFPNSPGIVGFYNTAAPTSTVGAKFTVTGILNTTSESGTISISINGATALTGTVSATSIATFVSSFNANTSFSGASIVASGTSSVVITGPAGTANTLSFAGSTVTETGQGLVASASGNDVIITGETGTANTLSISSGLTGTASDGTPCGTLFALTPSLSGTLPTNTFQSLMNMAKNPWISTANVASIYGLIPAQAFFTPYPPSAPSDYTLALLMQETAATYPTSTTSDYPYRLTMDANDNVYIWQENVSTSATAGDTVAIGNYGNPAWVSQYTGTEIATRGIAADGIGNIWIGNYTSSATMYQINAATGAGIATKTITTTGGYSYGLAVDRQNNLWVSVARTTNTLQELPNTSAAPTALGTYGSATTIIDSGETGSSSSTGGGGFYIAVDNFQNIWTADYYESSTAGGDQDTVMENVGTITAPCYTSYNTGNTPACATTGSPTYYNYTLQGYAPSGIAFNQANYGTTPATGTYPFTEYGTDTLTSITSTLTGTGTVLGLNQFPLTETVSSGGVLSISSSATNEPIPTSGSSASGADYAYAVYIAIDGAGYVYEPDFTNHGIIVTKTTSTTPYYTVISEPIGFYPCVQLTAVACGTAMGNLRQGQIDSTGSFWTTSSSVTETLANGVVEIIGTATPAWPLLATGLNGVEP